MKLTPEEWEICMKVLKIIAREPDESLDTDTLKGLVTKIYKRAKKQNKSNALEEKLPNTLLSKAIPDIEKAKKTNKLQDELRQYDQALKAKTQLFQQYENNENVNNESFVTDNNFAFAKKCYQCKAHFTQVHFFYHTLCPTCAGLNMEKRNQTCDLEGRVALITGGRIKIGYLTALRMLRDGARVWVTTRFAKDCAKRFAQEKDFELWAHRLKVIVLDLRNLKAVQDFIDLLSTEETHLDIIINNAAQTVKRPEAFYQHLFDYEQLSKSELPKKLQQILPFDQPFQLLNSVEKQLLLPSEVATFFPKGELDKDGQQIDKRSTNSWKLRLDEVSPIELLETQLVNVTAPFMLNAGLKSLLLRSSFERKFIVNVSAMEGQFNRGSKTHFHPHTNMAKAALNMMTRTAAQDYATDNIFMNSVDTGWITQENPFPIKERLFQEENFVPPLDEIDGMARIYDPIARGLNEVVIPLFGHFLKDFKPYFW
jgi:NAD(P)-dependent dehydrogenase (short-subunit alcohol dehydrogenase family)